MLLYRRARSERVFIYFANSLFLATYQRVTATGRVLFCQNCFYVLSCDHLPIVLACSLSLSDGTYISLGLRTTVATKLLRINRF